MAYTTINDPTDYFNTVLYTGNGSTQSITGVGFQPDWVWLKRRDNAGRHRLFDAVRGATKSIRSDDTEVELTRADSLTSFDSDGFTLGADSTSGGINVNISGETMVGWNWLANGSGSSNTDGDITSTVSVNQTSGFSIVRWDGNGTAGDTVGHGLGSEMKFMILRDKAQATSSITYHHSLGNQRGINLNETGVGITSSNYWNSTSPTSSVFSTGVYSNESAGEYICYCFAEKKGFSKFGSYTGNGSTDGAFIYTGFKPAFYMVKRTDSTGSWIMKDNLRPGYNVNGSYFVANDSLAESTGSGNVASDELSNGFKIRGTSSSLNTSGGSYIYMAFAESPFTTSTGVPTTAR
jgi:hypothetical protein